MRDTGRASLTPEDFVHFDRSIQPLISSVEAEIEAYERTLPGGPSWTTLGEFVIDGRIFSSIAPNISWNACSSAVCGCIFAKDIDPGGPTLFEGGAQIAPYEQMNVPILFSNSQILFGMFAEQNEELTNDLYSPLPQYTAV